MGSWARRSARTSSNKAAPSAAASQTAGKAASGESSNRVRVVTVMSSAAPFQSKRL